MLTLSEIKEKATKDVSVKKVIRIDMNDDCQNPIKVVLFDCNNEVISCYVRILDSDIYKECGVWNTTTNACVVNDDLIRHTFAR